MPRGRLRELPGVGCILSCFSLLSFSSRTRASDNISTYDQSTCEQSQLTKNVVSELRELQTHLSELFLGLGTQRVTSGSPEVRNGSTYGRIVPLGMCVDVSRICDFALCGRVDTMDLGRCEGLERGEVERLPERVNSRVL